MPEIDKVIHQPVRLRVMSALMTLRPEEKMSFSHMGKALGLTDGNLGAHLQTLEKAGYVAIEKRFINRKPCTQVSATHLGREKFHAHVTALKAILGE